MKIKVLMVLNLAAFLVLSGCGSCGGGNVNNNANVNKTNVNAPTPVTKTNESASIDPNLKSKIESALKAKGFNDVTVDVTTTPATLRGTVAKGKMAEAVQVAQEANGGKPVKSELTEK